MLKIGDFARIASVSVKTLRFYASEGLLVPVMVNRYNGYRYYTEEQLDTLNRILALKEMGVSLEQVRDLLSDSLTPSELRGLLRVKRLELQERVNAEQERLNRVEDRLRRIESEGASACAELLANIRIQQQQKELSMQPIRFETLPAFKVMGMKYRGTNPNQEIAQMWGKLNTRIQEIPISGECAYGVCFVLNDTFGGEFEYVAGFKVEDGAKAPEGMVVVDVPASRYAVFAHRGSIDTLRQTYHDICDVWWPSSGFTPCGYDMEVYTEEWKGFSPDSVFYIYEQLKE
jgi:predicted transcriptional regulator YdeE